MPFHLPKALLLAACFVALVFCAAIARRERSASLMSYFPDPSSTRHASREEAFLRKEMGNDHGRVLSALHQPEMERAIGDAMSRHAQQEHIRQIQERHKLRDPTLRQAAATGLRPATGGGVQALSGGGAGRGRGRGGGDGDTWRNMVKNGGKQKGMSIVSMAIHDIQRHHDARFKKTLSSEMNSAAKEYAETIDSAVKFEKQSEGERARARAREAAKDIERQKQARLRDAKRGWNEAAEGGGAKRRWERGGGRAKASGGWEDLF